MVLIDRALDAGRALPLGDVGISASPMVDWQRLGGARCILGASAAPQGSRLFGLSPGGDARGQRSKEFDPQRCLVFSRFCF